MEKQRYLDLAEKVLGAYTADDIRLNTKDAEERGIYEHGFPRLTACLGILAAHGRAKEYKDDFLKMMTLCCEQIPTALQRNGGAVGNDFSVKEIVLCLLEVENAGIFDKPVTEKWRANLAKIDPYAAYTAVAVRMRERGERVHNWAAFSAASEQLKLYAGIGGDRRFIDEQIASQLEWFDENGMYRDPAEPILYDFMTRLQLCVAIYFGYDGRHRAALLETLLKSAELTLDMQSVTGEIPFGGRSAQFLFNEACYSALCEFYAELFNRSGNTEKAGLFKSAAAQAAQSVTSYLTHEKISHIKNRFDPHEGFGCESYAYFDKYMITAASNLYLAYAMANETIAEKSGSSHCKNGIFQTSAHFHKIMCRRDDYFIEIETKADGHYDANGLGRVHKKGAPSAICLSVPFAKEPNYRINGKNPSFLSVAARAQTENGSINTSDPDVRYTLIESSEDGRAFVKFLCVAENGAHIEQSFAVGAGGVTVEAEADGQVEIMFPMLSFDGERYARHMVGEKQASVLYAGWCCRFLTDGTIGRESAFYENRNGRYAVFYATGEGHVSLKIEIEESGKIF